MGKPINSDYHEYCSKVTPDGKYFFFMSSRNIHKDYSSHQLSYREKMKIVNRPGNNNGDIYWIDATIIEKFRLKANKEQKDKDD